MTADAVEPLHSGPVMVESLGDSSTSSASSNTNHRRIRNPFASSIRIYRGLRDRGLRVISDLEAARSKSAESRVGPRAATSRASVYRRDAGSTPDSTPRLSYSDAFESVSGRDEPPGYIVHTDSSKPAAEPDHLRQLVEQYGRLRDTAAALWDTSRAIGARRTRIQSLRYEKNEATRSFMSALQEVLRESPGLQHLYRTVQDADLRCQEAEYQFDEVVDELHNGLVALEMEDHSFFATAGGQQRRTRPPEHPLLRGITGDRPVFSRPVVSHPQVEELKDALAKLQLALELLVNTRMKRSALNATKAQPLAEDTLTLMKMNYGEAGARRALELSQAETLTAEEEEDLQVYNDLEQRAVEDIQHYTDRANSLERLCREMGVMPPDFGADMAEDIQLETDETGSEGPRDRHATLAHSTFPMLLANPMHLLAAFPRTAWQSLRSAVSQPGPPQVKQKRIDEAAREVNIHRLLAEARAQDTSDYVNRWLLHKLYLSPMEVATLYCTFTVRLQVLDFGRWQQDVLHHWWRDQAVNLPQPLFDGGSEPTVGITTLSAFDQRDRWQSQEIDERWSI
ncbi:hypothetical protein GGR56DRAFT_657097 [Xylariaceae sp. FL0804]|nr:hypothetical protein GGR56DRAFT_657097 [Xylariaceae sp. FL0804]